MPLHDASRALRISVHTIRKVMTRQGEKNWPFQRIKKNLYRLSWIDIEEARDALLQTYTEGEIFNALMKAKSTGWLMRKIHDTSVPAPTLDSITDWSFFDNFVNADDFASQMSMVQQGPDPNFWDGLFD